jgi:uncharacterized protein YabN with tetrapyrrole methylase and pyrophosphatase domain
MVTRANDIPVGFFAIDPLQCSNNRKHRRGSVVCIGDLLFAVVNLARHLDVDPETALRTCNLKVERRFAAIDDGLAAVGKRPEDATLAEMDALWDAAKATEKSRPSS